MMQTRNSSSHARTVLIVSLVIILIVGVLYFMKRVEANRLGAELNLSKTEKREREEDLNAKLTDYLHKMEEMTRQLGDLQSRFTSCEDEKASLLVEHQKAKGAVQECQDQQSQHVQKLGAVEGQLKSLQDEHDGANAKLNTDLMQLRQALTSADDDVEQCHTESTQCQNSLSSTEAQIVQLRTQIMTCQQQQQQHIPVQQTFNQQPSMNRNVYQPQQAGSYPGFQQSRQINNVVAPSVSARVPVGNNQPIDTNKQDVDDEENAFGDDVGGLADKDEEDDDKDEPNEEELEDQELKDGQEPGDSPLDSEKDENEDNGLFGDDNDDKGLGEADEV